MKHGETKNVTVQVKDIQFTRNNELVIVCTPNDINPKGSYVMSAAQEARILDRAGIPDANTLKHLVALANGTAKMSFVSTFMKAGEAWSNGKTGAAHKGGIVGEKNGGKDWTNYSNHEIDLGFIVKTTIAEKAIEAMFSRRNNRSAAPVAKVVPVVEVTDTNFEQNPSTEETTV